MSTISKAIWTTPIKSTVTPLLSLLFLMLPTSGFADVALNNDCEPKGIIANIQVKLSSKKFWAKQLDEVEKAIHEERMWPGRLAEINRETTEINREMEATISEIEAQSKDFYREFPDLRPSPAEQRVQMLRDKADRIERDEMYAKITQYTKERIKVLQKCRRKILSRLSK